MSSELNKALNAVDVTATADIEAAKDEAIEAAQEAVVIAEQTAEQIAAAAMESERGKAITDLRQDLNACRDNQSSISMTLENLKSQVMEMAGKIEALLTPQPALLIQPPLEPKPPAEPIKAAVQEIAATASDQSANIENAILPRKVAKRFL